MVKVKYGAIVSDMAGSIGGDTFAKNHYGSYMRKKGAHLPPTSNRQLNVQGMFQQVMQLFRSLDETQLKNWQTACQKINYIDVFGDKKTLTAEALFVKCNMNLLLVQHPTTLVAPSYGPFDIADNLYNIVADETNQIITFDLSPDPLAPSAAYKVYATPAISPRINFPKNYFRQIAVIHPNNTGTIDISTPYYNYFGAQRIGLAMWIKVVPVQVNTGIQGLFLQDKSIFV